MQRYLIITFAATLLGIAAAPASAGSMTQGGFHLAQNTGATARSLGNGSMGTGEGIERLPEQLDRNMDLRDVQASDAYDQSSHGDTDPDMEHRPRRTLGDRDDDDQP